MRSPEAQAPAAQRATAAVRLIRLSVDGRRATTPSTPRRRAASPSTQGIGRRAAADEHGQRIEVHGAAAGLRVEGRRPSWRRTCGDAERHRQVHADERAQTPRAARKSGAAEKTAHRQRAPGRPESKARGSGPKPGAAKYTGAWNIITCIMQKTATKSLQSELRSLGAPQRARRRRGIGRGAVAGAAHRSDDPRQPGGARIPALRRRAASRS